MFGDEYTDNASKLKHIFKSWSKASKKVNDHVEKYLFHNTATEIFLRMQNKESSVYIQCLQLFPSRFKKLGEFQANSLSNSVIGKAGNGFKRTKG